MVNTALIKEEVMAKKNRSYSFILLTGYFAAIVQILFLRECLAIFSGNELIIGLVIAVWLGAGAFGSRIGSRIKKRGNNCIALFCILSLITGITLLRAVPLFFNPGESVSPFLISVMLLITEFPSSFFAGFAFGAHSKYSNGKKLYIYENVGGLVGLTIVSIGILIGITNGLLAIIAALPLLFTTITDKYCFIIGVCVIVFAISMDSRSRIWKYAVDVSEIVYGNESEIAFSRSEGMDLVIENNNIHYTDLSYPLIEQAVHIPLSVRNKAKRVLVINDYGHIRELEKYVNIESACIRSEPVLAKLSGCTKKISDDFFNTGSCDVIILGNDIPETVSSNRFFTESFFKKMKSLLTDSGVFSFTLQFNTNYLNEYESKIKDVLFYTLAQVFKNVKIFPGQGYTFLASDLSFDLPDSCRVENSYLQSYIFPDITNKKIKDANKISGLIDCNRVNRPVILALSLKRYLRQYDFHVKVIVSVAVLIIVFVLFLVIPNRAGISVGTTGFSVAIYSLIILLLYQSSHGKLYSWMSILMIGLSTGFILGSLVKRFPYSDFITGFYMIITISIIIKSPYMPFLGYFLMHMGGGVLSGAQFVTRKQNHWGDLNGADLGGGILGAMLGTTLMIPQMGIMNTAGFLLILKLFSGIVVKTWKNN